MKLLILVLVVPVFLALAVNRKKTGKVIPAKQSNQKNYDMGLQAFRKGDYETALYFFDEICKKKDGRLFRDSYELRKKSQQALKAQYEEKRRKNYAEIEELYRNGQYKKALHRLEYEAFLVNPSPAVSAMYEDCKRKLSGH